MTATVQEDTHLLVAGYVLDALDDGERRTFEEHLRGCTVCREELESLQRAAAALAYAAAGEAPPPGLRRRVVAAARREDRAAAGRSRGAWLLPATAGLAGLAAAAAVALAVWTSSLSSSLSGERTARRAQTAVLSIVARPGAVRLALRGGRGAVVAAPDGEAALVVPGLPAAPSGSTYEVWLIEGASTLPAGVFAGGADDPVVTLTRPFTAGARIGVSLERSPGASSPTGPMLLRTETS